MSAKANKAFTKEEELLLQDFSRNVSTKSSALFYGNGFIVSAIPIWLFWRVHSLELSTSLAWFVLVTAASTWLLALAYRNTKFHLKHRIAVRREDAVAREMSRKLADDKKMSRKEKDERTHWKFYHKPWKTSANNILDICLIAFVFSQYNIVNTVLPFLIIQSMSQQYTIVTDVWILWKKNEVADYEATTYSIFYNNALFLTIVILSSFYILRTLSPAVNYIVSLSVASGLLALLSTGTK